MVKWFPDKRGLITGIAVGGFGAGALITAPVATRFHVGETIVLRGRLTAQDAVDFDGIAFTFSRADGGRGRFDGDVSRSRDFAVAGRHLPLPLVMWRLVRRTVQRAATKAELWNTGNRESFRNAFLSRQSILLWALKTHRRNRERYAAECGSLAKEKRIVRLQNKRDVDRFVTRH